MGGHGMTREEEIEQAWFLKACMSTHCYDEKSFKEAIEWADKTMIEKACKWLKEKNKMCMYELEMILGGNFIDDFKRYLEE